MVGDDGEPLRLVGTCQDVTEQHELVTRLAGEALLDPLTGLHNRVSMVDRLEHALARRDTVTAVLFLDVDDFKRVNDDLGHEAGDRVLLAVGDHLRRCVRTGDTVARVGGDEFVVVCEDLRPTADIHAIAERVVQVIEVETAEHGPPVFITTSVGLAIATSGDAADAVLRAADSAMYRAKRRGRGLVEVHADGGS